MPAIYDPATTVQGPGGTTRTRSPGTRFRSSAWTRSRCELLARYPLPTSAGTANNYRRTDDESVDQDLFSLRLDHRLGTGRDRVFGRLTRFLEDFVPVTPLPDGSGVTSGTLGPQSTRAWSFASSYQRTFSTNAINELRVGDTRRTVRRAAAELDGPASETLGLPGIPTYARFPNTLPTFLVAGYAQLGSPPNTATEFGTSVTQIADSLTWVAGSHAIKLGADLRWSRLDVVQPPSPTGSFSFSSLFTDLPGVANTGNPLASFLLGQVQQFSIDLQQDEIRNRAHIQEYFVQDDWRLSRRITVNAGVRYTLNFPSVEENDQAAVFNVETQQLEYLGQDGQPRAARQLHKRNFGPASGWWDASPIARSRARRTGWCGSSRPASRRRLRLPCFRSCRPSPSARSTTCRPPSCWPTGPTSSPFRSRRRRALVRASSPWTATWGRGTSSSGTRRSSASSDTTSRSKSPTWARRSRGWASPTRT